MSDEFTEKFSGSYPECKTNRSGEDYQARLNHTIAGFQCKQWSKTIYNDSSYFYGNSIDDVGNSCRNPGGWWFGPWCYVTNEEEEWGLCGIPICEAPDQDNDIYVKMQWWEQDREILTELYDAANSMVLITYPICLVFGTVFNVLSMIVFTHQSLFQLTTSFLLLCLACTDTIALCMGTISHWLKVFMGSAWYLPSTLMLKCKIYNYFYYIVSSLSAWILVILALDRVVVLAKPLQSKLICTKKNVSILLLSVLTAFALLEIPDLLGGESDYSVIFHQDAIHFTVFAHCHNNISAAYWIHMIFHSIAPFSIILLFNTIIITLLLKVHNDRITIAVNVDAQAEAFQMRMLSITLLVTAFTFIILRMPHYVYMIYEHVHMVDMSMNHLLFVCTMLFEYVNYSVNFLLYCIAMKRFRHIFCSIVKLCVCK